MKATICILLGFFPVLGLTSQYEMSEETREKLETSFQTFSKGSEEGFSPSAAYQLGLLYAAGIGTSVDYEKALLWLARATAQDDIITFAEKSMTETLQKQAEDGDIFAELELGLRLMNQYGSNKINVHLENVITKYIKNENYSLFDGYQIDQQIRSIGWQYFSNKKMQNRFLNDFVRRSCEAYLQKESEGFIFYGYCHEMSFMSSFKYTPAEVSFFLYSHDRFDSSEVGDFLLGRAYERGFGCEKNILHAMFLYQKAAEKGFTEAQKAFVKGRSLLSFWEKPFILSEKTAYKWMKKAALQRDREAISWLADQSLDERQKIFWLLAQAVYLHRGFDKTAKIAQKLLVESSIKK